VGIKVGVGAVVPDGAREPDEAEGAALAADVAREALRIGRDPLLLLPLPSGCRAGLIVPRLADVADRIPIAVDLRATAALLRPRIGASVGVLEVAVQPDERAIGMAAEWAAAQDVAVLLCFDAHRATRSWRASGPRSCGPAASRPASFWRRSTRFSKRRRPSGNRDSGPSVSLLDLELSRRCDP